MSNKSAHYIAAFNAYYAAQKAAGKGVDKVEFESNFLVWEAVVKAVRATECPEWPYKARVWTQTENNIPARKILEIAGKDIVARHPQSLEVDDKEIPFLPELYPAKEIPSDASRYVHQIYEHKGEDGLYHEAKRLIKTIKTATTYISMASHAEILAPGAGYVMTMEDQIARKDISGLSRTLDKTQSFIVDAQKKIDTHTKISLILHTSEENWSKYNSYASYIGGFKPA